MTQKVDDKVSRPARAFVSALVGLLVIFAAVDVELWPLTGWRLFSTLRDEAQTGWVAEATDSEGSSRIVSYEELPLGYRNTAWIVADLPDASTEKREAVCRALFDAITDVEPGTASVRVARDRVRLEERDGERVVIHDLETLQTCDSGQAP